MIGCNISIQLLTLLEVRQKHLNAIYLWAKLFNGPAP